MSEYKSICSTTFPQMLTLILVVQLEWCFELTIVMLVVVVSAAMPANIVRDPVQGWSSIDVVVPVLAP
jgi:hypothetical protein